MENLSPLRSWEREFRSHALPGDAQGFLAQDGQAEENRRFPYRLFSAQAQGPSRHLILLLHGLNERSWNKYLPWAKQLAVGTGATIVLFPLAFHMDRSPRLCQDMESVFRIYRGRKAQQGSEGASSHANAVLSTRLEDRPFRFFTSGLQSYRDIVDLVRQVRAGIHPDFHPCARVDFFGYSIGAFLSELLLMADPQGLFASSRLFAFCGGSVMDGARACSRAILDAGAERALSALFRSLTEGDWRLDGSDELSSGQEWQYFLSMLSADRMAELRSARLAQIGSRIACLGLEKDEVYPPEVLRSTLGDRVRVLDFPFEYKHESPFPSALSGQEALRQAMHAVFGPASEFLGAAS